MGMVKFYENYLCNENSQMAIQLETTIGKMTNSFYATRGLVGHWIFFSHSLLVIRHFQLHLSRNFG
jgi:hypothetical protein